MSRFAIAHQQTSASLQSPLQPLPQRHSTQRHGSQSSGPQSSTQQGAVLIVCLVMLTILTIIAVGTISDTNLQANMARNSQLSLRVFNTTLSEIKGQFNASEQNHKIDGADTDPDAIRYQKILSNVYQTETDYILKSSELTVGTDNPFEQKAKISFIREGPCGGGNKIGASGLIFELSALTYLPNTGSAETGIRSDQTFGVCYPNPNN